MAARANISQGPRLRLKRIEVPENDLQVSVVKALDVLLLSPAKFTALNMGHVDLSDAQAAKVHRMGCKPSWPDLIVSHHGIYGIELKRVGAPLTRSMVYRTAKGTLRERRGQAEVFPELEQSGMRIAVCHSVDEVLTQLKQWGIPLRPHA